MTEEFPAYHNQNKKLGVAVGCINYGEKKYYYRRGFNTLYGITDEDIQEGKKQGINVSLDIEIGFNKNSDIPVKFIRGFKEHIPPSMVNDCIRGFKKIDVII